MGIFDKLFGRNKNVSNPEPHPVSYSEPPAIAPPKVRSNIETEALIERNPYSSQYRLKDFQFDLNLTTLDYIPFYQKAEGKFVTLDLETTGFSYKTDKIVEIAAVKVIDGQIVETYQQYVNPETSMPANVSSINHITDDMLIDKPYIFEVLPDLLHFIGDNIVVAHNVAFDLKFLAQSCMQYRFRIPADWFDSMDLSVVWPEAPNRKLKTLLEEAGIPNKNEHSASGDAEALALLMIASMKKEVHLQIPYGVDPGYSIDHFKGPVDLLDNCLSGKRFVVTGEIKGYERYDFEKLIASHGGKPTLKISNATDYLIVGSFDSLPPGYISSKIEYANKLISEGGKIKMISPDEFFDILKMPSKEQFKKE